MGVPFEALIPYAIVIGVRLCDGFLKVLKVDHCQKMFGVSGAGLAGIKYIQNGGKGPRYSLDKWDNQSKQCLVLCGLDYG